MKEYPVTVVEGPNPKDRILGVRQQERSGRKETVLICRLYGPELGDDVDSPIYFAHVGSVGISGTEVIISMDGYQLEYSQLGEYLASAEEFKL
jgi:hypothetical protein